MEFEMTNSKFAVRISEINPTSVTLSNAQRSLIRQIVDLGSPLMMEIGLRSKCGNLHDLLEEATQESDLNAARYDDDLCDLIQILLKRGDENHALLVEDLRYSMGLRLHPIELKGDRISVPDDSTIRALRAPEGQS
jgi:hypothetical protein